MQTLRTFFETGSAVDRNEAVAKALSFIGKYESGQKPKALYIFGKFGVGKTYLLGAIANQLAEKQISSLIVYFPDFLRELKGQSEIIR